MIVYKVLAGFLIIVFFLVVIGSIVKKDASILVLNFFVSMLLILILSTISDEKERIGIVCDIKTTQTSYVQTVVEGEIEQVPIYSYLILIQTKDNEYRTLITKNPNYGVLKIGDKITYTYDNTEKIKEE